MDAARVCCSKWMITFLAAGVSAIEPVPGKGVVDVHCNPTSLELEIGLTGATSDL